MHRKKILVIDGEPGVRKLCAEILEKEGCHISFASNWIEGINKLEDGNFDLILLDSQVFLQTIRNNLAMTNLSGEKIIEAMLEIDRIIGPLTDLDLLLEKMISIVNNIFLPERIAIYLAEDGNFILRKHISKRYLKEEFPVSYGSEEVSSIFLSRNARITEDKGETITIPLFGKERNIGFITIKFSEGRKTKEEEIKFLEVFATQVGLGIENANLFELVKNSYLNSIRALVNALEAKDAYTKGHSEQVAYYSFLIGKRLGLTDGELKILRTASYLHDIGKLGIRDTILLKPGPLNKEEMELVRKHLEIAAKILEPLGLKSEEMNACLYHHERIDGMGYPKGLKNKEIPLFAKILSVADAYSAMISDRPYRKRLTKEEAITELKRCAGEQFDGDIVNVFVKLLKEENEGEEEKHG